MARAARDLALLDAIERLPVERYQGQAWRVVREGRDPVHCSAVGGRWDDRSFDVLYTSTKADGALAELYFHLSRGQPVIPSQVRYRLYELTVALRSCVQIVAVNALVGLGLDTGLFGQLSYEERQKEYPRTQQIADAAHFHGRDGMIVRSARSERPNIVVFCERTGPAAVTVVRDLGDISWDRWRQTPFGY